jgi:hypothetical protein
MTFFGKAGKAMLNERVGEPGSSEIQISLSGVAPLARCGIRPYQLPQL